MSLETYDYYDYEIRGARVAQYVELVRKAKKAPSPSPSSPASTAPTPTSGRRSQRTSRRRERTAWSSTCSSCRRTSRAPAKSGRRTYLLIVERVLKQVRIPVALKISSYFLHPGADDRPAFADGRLRAGPVQQVLPSISTSRRWR